MNNNNNNDNNNLKTLYLISFILILTLSINGVQAFSEGYCVDVSITDINPTSVELDSEVTVGVQFENCGDKTPEIVNFEIRRFSEDIIIKEPLVINFTKPLSYANGQRFNVYHLYVSRDAVPGEYVFEYKLTYGNKDLLIEKEDNFSITVISDEADLNIALVKTDPVIPKVGEEMTLTIRIENFGKGDANSVKAKVDLPFFGTKEAFLGSLETQDDSPAIFTLVPDKSGSFDYNIDITYNDDYGEHKITEKLELNVQNKDKNWFLIFGVLSLIILGIIYFYFKKRKKNEQKRS